jgi:hypothetical protein
MYFRRYDIGQQRSFPQPPSMRTYQLNVSPSWHRKVCREAEKAGVTPETYITEAVRATLGGDETTWHAEEKAQ